MSRPTKLEWHREQDRVPPEGAVVIVHHPGDWYELATAEKADPILPYGRDNRVLRAEKDTHVQNGPHPHFHFPPWWAMLVPPPDAEG